MGRMERTRRAASRPFRTRHWRSVLSALARTDPAKHQAVSETAAATPKAKPSQAARTNGLRLKAAKDAAAPSVIAHPLGFWLCSQIPPRKLMGVRGLAEAWGEPL